MYSEKYLQYLKIEDCAKIINKEIKEINKQNFREYIYSKVDMFSKYWCITAEITKTDIELYLLIDNIVEDNITYNIAECYISEYLKQKEHYNKCKINQNARLYNTIPTSLDVHNGIMPMPDKLWSNFYRGQYIIFERIYNKISDRLEYNTIYWKKMPWTSVYYIETGGKKFYFVIKLINGIYIKIEEK